MNAKVRRKLSMVDRVLTFERENPSDEASHTALVTRLQEIADQARSRSVQQSEGGTAESSARSQRRALRREIAQGLRHLRRVGEAAAQGDSSLSGVLEPPGFNLPNRAFIAAASAMLEVANTHATQLAAAGLSATFLADLGSRIAEFNGAGVSADGGRLGHISAHADLETLAHQIVTLIRVLDGDNRARFRKNSTVLAEWQAVKSIFGSSRSRGPAPEPPAAAEAPPASTDAAA